MVCRSACVLAHQLRCLDWATLRALDKRRLDGVLARLDSDLALARSITHAEAGRQDG